MWLTRLNEICEAGVWDAAVGRQLGVRYYTKDESLWAGVPGSEPPEVQPDEVARTLWIMAAGFCRDDFPEGVLEAGPPGS